MTCGDAAREYWGPWLADLAGPIADLPALPARGDLDPLIADLPDDGRLVVAGDDAALAAVLVRLLRRERLAVAVAVLPGPGSTAAAVYDLPADPAAAVALARDGAPRPTPLVRDDHGGVVAAHHEVGPFHGAVYCDEHLLADGDATGLTVVPDPAGGGVTVAVTGPRRLGGLRSGRLAMRSGRAAQIGCRPGVPVTRDGIPGDRPVTRRSWYRHTEDWRLVRPLVTSRGVSTAP